MSMGERDAISQPVVALLKGVLHRESDEDLWRQLLAGQAAVRDYVSVIGLELVLDEAEGFAWLRQREAREGDLPLPRLITRRQLPYLPSLLLALLRKKLAETDVSGEAQRLVLSREELVDLVKVFLPRAGNEARLSDQVLAAANRLEDLGFVRRLKGQESLYEVRRVLKAFVDAQWLADFDDRLAEYRGGARGAGGMGVEGEIEGGYGAGGVEADREGEGE